MHDMTRCVMKPDVPEEGFSSLATPVHRASTIVFETAEAFESRGERGLDGYSYGLYGTPTTRALEARINALEGGFHTFLAPSGQAANAFAMLAVLKPGQRVLMAESCYPPARDFALQDLARQSIAVDFFDPLSLTGLSAKLTPETGLVWCESPGSTTMEVQDIPAIAALAHRSGALVGCDNTWATPLLFKPLEHGADIVTEALTKYFCGTSDILMGSVSVRDPELAHALRRQFGRYGVGVSADDASHILRSMESMPLRLAHAGRVAEELAARFAADDLVDAVLLPSRPECPGHAVWKRDFAGVSGVFSVLFCPPAVQHVPPALNGLATFAIGASWGGSRSLMAPLPIREYRTGPRWQDTRFALRVSAGLEDPRDLMADVDALLERIRTRIDKQDRARTGIEPHGVWP